MRALLSLAVTVLASPLALGSDATPPLPEPTTAPPELVRIFLDAKGDGFDLGMCSPRTKHRGPSPASDERVLALDVATAARLGFRIVALEGPLGSAAPFGGSLRLTPPSGTPFEPATGWDTFALLDRNKDGVLDARDLIWPALRVAQDLDGDGRLDGAEVAALESLDVRQLGPWSVDPARRDASGNELTLGRFYRSDDTFAPMADVRLASCEPRLIGAGLRGD